MSDEVLKRIEHAKSTGSKELDLSGCSLQTLPEALLELPGLISIEPEWKQLKFLAELVGEIARFAMV